MMTWSSLFTFIGSTLRQPAEESAGGSQQEAAHEDRSPGAVNDRNVVRGPLDADDEESEADRADELGRELAAPDRADRAAGLEQTRKTLGRLLCQRPRFAEGLRSREIDVAVRLRLIGHLGCLYTSSGVASSTRTPRLARGCR